MVQSSATPLTAAIVVYRPDLEVLGRALAALRVAVERCRGELGLEARIFVIDNSCDAGWLGRVRGTVEEADRGEGLVELVASDANRGYGYGNNRVLARIGSEVHVVMNPDVFVAPDALLVAVRHLRAHPRVGLVLADVHGEDGERHFLCKRNPTLFDMFLRGFAPGFVRRLFRGRMAAFEMREQDYDRPIAPVPYPTGCFMVFRAPRFAELGGFDERFFLYLEDADIGRRMLALADVVYLPQVRVVHRWARGTHRSWRLKWVTVESALLYWRKWGGVF